ncbi:OmpA family protein [Sandaracinobacteroides hominis]|uniref:OmpA family protein n=1 Tax=Sandaracinobacteroides hominis TaxID=2780086 RepID=UPI0018F714FD|nr:OmpA family protein [Sandaracinobacteroides hominis]
MTNLVETIMGALPANTGDALGSMLGDNPDSSVKGLSAILPLLLAAFAGKAASGADLGGLVSTISGGIAGGNPLDNPAALLSGSAPASTGLGGLASQILGSNMVPIATAVAAMFGLKNGTVNSLMALAGPLLVGGIGKALGGAPTVHGLRNLLATEKDSYESMLPPQLRQLISPVAPAAAAAPVAETAASSGIWKWLLLALAILALLWYLFGRGTKEEVVTPAAVEPAAVQTAPVAAPVIPTGSGVIAQDRAGLPLLVVFFDVGKSDVSTDLAAASAAVKSYYDSHPQSRLSVSGFNDPTGDAAANAELSKNRAEQVKAALVAAGFAADRVDLDKPAAPTDTSEGYAAARRVEVTIKQ